MHTDALQLAASIVTVG